jgi:hypothetical protein
MEANELDPTDPNDLKAIADEIIKSNYNFDISVNSSENSAKAAHSATVQAIPKKPTTAKNQSASINTAASNEINLVVDLNSNNLIQGLIMSEILGSPKAKKWRGNTIWNSRF